MTAKKKTTVIAAGCLIFFLAASTIMVRSVDRLRPTVSGQDVLYFESPKAIKRASLGYTGLMACIYWTRVVQYFGSHHHSSATHYNLLAPLLTITTYLDPHLVIAYEFGANFLAPAPPNGAGEPDKAIQLINYGIQHNRDNWHLYYDLGFVYYMDVKDYAKAAQVFVEGSRLPHTHPYLKLLAAQMAEHAGEYQTARMLWSATYENTEDQQIRKNATDHLRAIRVDEDVRQLQMAVTRFGEQTGRLPSSMHELASFMELRALPVDPDGIPYKLDPDGRVLVAHPDDFPFITRGLPPGYKPPVPGSVH